MTVTVCKFCLYHLSRSPYGYGRPLVPLSDFKLSLGVRLGVAGQTVFAGGEPESLQQECPLHCRTVPPTASAVCGARACQ